MATVLTDDTHYYDIATAIRAKLGVATKYLPSEMADAIELIGTGGAELTSEDEGKVVVESDGEYVLQAQTSTEITSNGTYDTTTNNEVVVSVSGGATNILSGAEEPSADEGTNGDIYLMYTENDYDVTLGLTKRQESESNMTVTVGDDSVSFAYNSGAYIGALAYQLVDLTNANKLSFVAVIGTKHYNRNAALRFNPHVLISPQSGGYDPTRYWPTDNNITTYGVWSGGEDGTSENAAIDVSEYTGNHYVVFSAIGCTTDYNDIFIGTESGDILETYLKVGGAWNPIKHQNIADVNTGGSSG